jgi:perosamine synthetase
MIPITRLSVGPAEAAAAAEVVTSGWLAQGKRAEKFEALVAEYVGAKHGVAVSSCTTGTHLALHAAGIGPGDEVICPSYSFIATANAILYAGATPAFVDIEPDTYNIDAARIEAAITARTKAILPVSQIGLGCDLPAVTAVARRHGLVVVEDAAPSLGAKIGDRFVGSFSDFTVFSFDARKILTTGEGGVITTDDAAAADRLRNLRAHAASVSMLARHTSSNVVLEGYPEVGFNYKMTDMQAAIGVVQMGKVEAFVAERRRLAARYTELLGGDDRLGLPGEPPGYRHVYQSYCVRLPAGVDQRDMMERMAARGVATRRIIAIHEEPAFRRLYPHLSLPNTERATRETLLLPMFVGLTDREQDEVAAALLDSLNAAAGDRPAARVLASTR